MDLTDSRWDLPAKGRQDSRHDLHHVVVRVGDPVAPAQCADLYDWVVAPLLSSHAEQIEDAWISVANVPIGLEGGFLIRRSWMDDVGGAMVAAEGLGDVQRGSCGRTG